MKILSPGFWVIQHQRQSLLMTRCIVPLYFLFFIIMIMWYLLDWFPLKHKAKKSGFLFFISQERNFVSWSEQSMDVFIRLWSTLDPDEACISSKILIMQNWKLDRMFNIWWCYKISRSYKIIINHTLLRLNYYDLNISIIYNVSNRSNFWISFLPCFGPLYFFMVIDQELSSLGRPFLWFKLE